MIKQQSKRFHYTVAKTLHWIAFMLIGFNLIFSWRLNSFDQNIKEILVMIHTGVGVSVLFLMLFRWWWRRTRKLYTPPGWYKRPAMLLQYAFYPLVIAQVVIGVIQAAVIDYDVLAFGVINISALAAENPAIHELWLSLHVYTAVVLILMVIVHGLERYKSIFTDTGSG